MQHTFVSRKLKLLKQHKKMKKIYTTAAALILGGLMFAQTPFYHAVNYKGAFPVTDGLSGTTSNDWSAGWANWDPENVNYASTNTTVSSDITSNTTWTTGMVIDLQNKVFVKNNATLTIQPGVIIRGDFATQGTLIITKGAKIIAQGTQTNPIVFTSNETIGNRTAGDWGGLVILGKGKINQPAGVANIEGLTATSDTEYGGTDDSDSSGIISYVRIEFAGIALQSNKEINGLTCGAVGSKTKLDHIQVSFGGDDSFEFFGGKVDANYLISFRTIDDDFDTDYGYRGRLQFGLVVRDKDAFDAAGDSNGFESDNEGTSPYLSQPLTSAVFSNFTVIGPKRDGTVSLPIGETFERGVYTRRNTSISIFNSLILGWDKGWHVKDAVTNDNFTTNDSAVFANNIITAEIPAQFVIDAGANSTQSFYNTIVSTDNIDTVSTIAQLAFANAFPTNLSDASDFRLQNSSVAATGGSFTDPKFNGQLVSINEKTTNDFIALKLYPNPAKEQFTIFVGKEKQSEMKIELFDITGKKVIDLNTNSAKATINTSELEAGIYFVRISDESTTKTMKVSVIK